METTIRIAVCNIQSGIGTTRGYWHYLLTGWKYALPHDSEPVARMASFLSDEKIDIAAICEIDGGSWRTRGVDQCGLVRRHSPLKHCNFFPTLVLGRRVNQGNAICARYPIRHVANHHLPGPGEPRLIGESEVDAGGRPVRILVTHLSLERKVRPSQIDHLSRVVTKSDVPTILAGDFNSTEEAELRLLAESNLQMALSAPTFPSWGASRALDRLFVSEHFSLSETHTFDRFTFSDHLPLVASLELAKGDRHSAG